MWTAFRHCWTFLSHTYIGLLSCHESLQYIRIFQSAVAAACGTEWDLFATFAIYWIVLHTTHNLLPYQVCCNQFLHNLCMYLLVGGIHWTLKGWSHYMHPLTPLLAGEFVQRQPMLDYHSESPSLTASWIILLSFKSRLSSMDSRLSSLWVSSTLRVCPLWLFYLG